MWGGGSLFLGCGSECPARAVADSEISRVYESPVAAVINEHKPRGLKQQMGIFSQRWTPGPKSASAGPQSLWSFEEKILPGLPQLPAAPGGPQLVAAPLQRLPCLLPPCAHVASPLLPVSHHPLPLPDKNICHWT